MNGLKTSPGFQFHKWMTNLFQLRSQEFEQGYKHKSLIEQAHKPDHGHGQIMKHGHHQRTHIWLV